MSACRSHGAAMRRVFSKWHFTTLPSLSFPSGCQPACQPHCLKKVQPVALGQESPGFLGRARDLGVFIIVVILPAHIQIQICCHCPRTVTTKSTSMPNAGVSKALAERPEVICGFMPGRQNAHVSDVSRTLKNAIPWYLNT